ncbi:hypothetical protein [Adhaeribacter soli]|uniref:DUF4252 domain-containing protein n=1 Tax=Adhaeribacter soli TaxID=2607655 RepID=A0A5N1IP80_9BACT|nr:hypothetical protein [Adhaeribacter soli]KAA9331824.1 hypothetical protein F0P94_13570 [Adhaeribacter soli]
MQKFFISLVLLVVFLSSCSNENISELSIFNNLAFRLHSKEKVMPLEAASEKKYRTYFNHHSQTQIPLLKHVKHQDYEIFIGIPYNTTLERLKKSRAEADPKDFSCAPNYCLKHYQRDSLTITEYIYRTSDQSLIFIAALTSSQRLSDSLFNALAMERRLFTKGK